MVPWPPLFSPQRELGMIGAKISNLVCAGNFRIPNGRLKNRHELDASPKELVGMQLVLAYWDTSGWLIYAW